MGYETVRQLVEALFVPEMVMKDTDGEAYLFLDKDADELYLKAPMSKYLALRKAETMAIIQVTPTDEPDTMRHTGFTRFKREPEEGEQKRKGQVFYSFPFLSAAIRASQEDVESGHIQNGSSHPGMLLDFDQQGDGGNPLITLTLNQPRRRNKAIKKSFSQNGYVHPKYTPIKKPKYVYNNLQIGQGPFDAKVVRLGKDHALVDFGVGRKFQASKERSEANTAVGSPEYVKVYGMLRFKDAIDLKSMAADKSRRNDTRKAKQQKAAEDKIFADMDNLLESVEGNLEDGEEVEDITNLFELNESGELTYKNPETGEVEVVSSNDDDEEDAFDSDYEEESKSVHDEPVTFVNNISPARQRRQAKILRLKVGEKVPVYISSIAKQSSQFMVTTDPSLVEGKTAKDIKKEGDVRKKLDRLSEVLGGLERAEELKGKEYYGTVKATSRAGDWLYVQPTGENEDDMSLPVGVATIGGEASAFSQGDRVRIRMDGIDESRGQLAMHVLEKLSP